MPGTYVPVVYHTPTKGCDLHTGAAVREENRGDLEWMETSHIRTEAGQWLNTQQETKETD